MRERQLLCLGHTGGLWFQLFGELADKPDKVWWRFTHTALRVRLAASESPGAIVQLADAAGKLVGLRQLGLVGNFSSQETLEAFFAVPPGEYRVSVLLTDGNVKRAPLVVGRKNVTWDAPPGRIKGDALVPSGLTARRGGE